jgi:hypothetical protein
MIAGKGWKIVERLDRGEKIASPVYRIYRIVASYSISLEDKRIHICTEIVAVGAWGANDMQSLGVFADVRQIQIRGCRGAKAPKGLYLRGDSTRLAQDFQGHEKEPSKLGLRYLTAAPGTYSLHNWPPSSSISLHPLFA